MRRAPNWTRRTLIVTVVSSLVGFWLLDGIAFVASLLGKDFKVEASGRIASIIVCVAFGLVVEQAHMITEELAAQRDELLRTVKSDIKAEVSDAMRQMLSTAGILAAASGGDSVSMRSLVSDLSSLIRPIAPLPEPLRSGAARWMRGPIESYLQSFNALISGGVSASLSEHVAVTRAMFDAGTGNYVQINLYAYDVEAEWTREWRAFLDHTKTARGREVSYVVFAGSDYLAHNDAKLRAMQSYLSKLGGKLLVCDRRLVSDSLGNFDLHSNLELFDESVIKTQASSKTGYRGGISLVMSIARAEDRPDLLRLINVIREAAVPYQGAV